MNFKILSGIMTLTLIGSLNLGMASRDDYDHDARNEETQAIDEKNGFKNPAKGIASGVKTATVDTTAGLLTDTAEGSKEGLVTGTLEGARKGTGKVLDGAVKGVAKVATLGQADVSSYEVTQPEAHSAESANYNNDSNSEKSMTKVTFKIPGT
jgi:hypothetical protein